MGEDMADMSSMGRMVVLLGLLVVGVGVVMMVAGRVPFLGRLPGDISIERGGWSFHFPLITSILISIVLTVVLNLLARR